MKEWAGGFFFFPRRSSDLAAKVLLLRHAEQNALISKLVNVTEE